MRSTAGSTAGRSFGAGRRSRDGLRPLKVAVAFALPFSAAVLPFIGLGSLTAYVFVAFGAASAWWLARIAKPTAVVFLVTVWMVAPLFRRLSDWALGSFTEQSLALYAPPLATALALVSVRSLMRRLRRRERDGLWLLALAMGLGMAVGLFEVGVRPAVFGAAEWLAPIGVGVFAVIALRQSQGAVRTVVDGLAVLTGAVALYGIYQYWTLPEWDEFWLVNVALDSQGSADVGEFRIFATSNSTGVLAVAVALLMLVLLWHYRFAYALPLTLSAVMLALTLVRVAWLMVAVGVLVVVLTSGRQRLFSLLATLGVVAAALSFLPSFSGDLGVVVDEQLSTRLQSFTDLSGDNSFQDRDEFLGEALDAVATQPLGYGFGSSGGAARSAEGTAAVGSFDNGWLNIPYTLGWIGAVAYLAGLSALFGVRDGARLLAMLPIAVGLFATNISVATSGVAVVVYGILAGRLLEDDREAADEDDREPAGEAGRHP